MSAEKESELELDELEAQFSEVRFFFTLLPLSSKII
jgi:hypothetical protein